MLPAGLRRLTALLVEYDGDNFLHERKILAFLPDDTLLVLTPHGDIYEERLDSYARIYVRGVRGGLPARWYQPGNRGHTVLFNDGDWQTSKDAIAAEWRVQYPSPRHGSLEAARAPAPAAGEPAAGRNVDGTIAPGAPQDALVVPAPATGEPVVSKLWVFIETRHGYDAGSPVPAGLGTITAEGDRGVLSFPAGKIVIAVVDTWSPPSDNVDDLRTLPISYDAQGQRSRIFTPTFAELSEATFSDWRISGPRTTLWLAKAVVSQDTTFPRRHTWWKNALRLTDSSEGVAEHMFISELLDAALCYDCLNIGQLSCMELASRRYQYWEQHYQESLRAGQHGSSPAKAWQASETGLFLGQERSTAVALVCPALAEHVSSRLKDEASILKERRKAREERHLVDGAGGGGGGGAGGGGRNGKKKGGGGAAGAKEGEG